MNQKSTRNETSIKNNPKMIWMPRFDFSYPQLGHRKVLSLIDRAQAGQAFILIQ